MWTAEAQTSLCVCTFRSGPSLNANEIFDIAECIDGQQRS